MATKPPQLPIKPTPIWTAFRWISGIFFILGGGAMMLEPGWFFTALSMLCLGLLLIPIISRALSNTKLLGSRFVRTLSAIFLFVLIGLTSPDQTPKTKAAKKQTDEKPSQPHAKSESATDAIASPAQNKNSANEPTSHGINKVVSAPENEVASNTKEIAKIENKLKNIPARLTFKNLQLYRELSRLDPASKRYKDKIKFYQDRLSEPMKVIGIADGDSITILTENKRQIEVELHGLDAPEPAQDYGRKAKTGLSDLMSRKTILVEQTGAKRDGKPLVRAYTTDGTYLNQLALEKGLGWYAKNDEHEKELTEAQGFAKARNVGIWSQGAAPMEPWEYRRRLIVAQQIAKDRAAQKAKPPREQRPKQQVNGNYWLNQKTGKRHNQGCRWYGDTSKGRSCGSGEGVACKICGG